MGDGGVKTRIAGLREAIGFEQATLDLCIEYVARRMNTGCVRLPKDDAVMLDLFYNHVVQPAVTMLHSSVQVLVAMHPDLFEVEKKIAAVGLDLCPLFDTLFTKWWQWVVIPQRTSSLGKQRVSEIIRKANKTNRWSVLMYSGGQPIEWPLTEEFLAGAVEVPLFNAFPDELKEACVILESLGRDTSFGEGEKDYLDYFRALCLALRQTELSQMGPFWLEADKAFVAIRNNRRIIPVHMMEWGYHDPERISPEFRLMWRTAEYSKELSLMRRAMVGFGREVDGESAETAINRVDIGVFLTLAFSGCNLDLRIAGQTLPNSPEVQELGLKVFLDSDSMARRFERFQELARKTLDVPTLAWVEKALTPEFSYLLVIGHELGHPLGVTRQLINAFGPDQAAVEEAKATLFGIAGICRAIQSGELGNDRAKAFRQLSAIVLIDAVRMMDKGSFGDETLAPYVNESLVILTILQAAGILRISEDGKLAMDEGVAGSEKPFECLYGLGTERLIAIYKAEDLSGLLRFASELANKEGEVAKAFFRAINEHLGA
jgi:hypothetical protein